MKFLFFFLVVCVAATSCSFIAGRDIGQKSASKEFLIRQKNLLKLLNHVNMINQDQTQVQIGRNFNIMANMDKFTNAQAVKEFLNFYKIGMLPKHRVFSISYRRLRDEAVSLFHMFYYAKDFDTFYRCACWAREHMNEGMFVYALTVAVLHRPDCRGFVLPAPYEIYPFFFLNNEVISKGQMLKMQGNIFDKKSADFYGVYQDDKTFYINSNYSGWYVHTNEENSLSYFTEDVGLNSYYFYFHADYPFWMRGDIYGLNKDRRGEIFYYTHQQLLARYYMERLSNDLKEIPKFSWNWPIKTGFMSNLRHGNGLNFPSRPNFFNVRTEKNLWNLQDVKDCERRIRDVVQSGFVLSKEGSFMNIKKSENINVLGNIIQGNGDCPNNDLYRYCGLIAKGILGNAGERIDKHKIHPGILEQYETALRDPMFYQLYKRLLHYFFRYKSFLQPYSREEFMLPGVVVEDINVDKLVTFFDDFDVDMTNAVYRNGDEVTKNKDNYRFVAKQRRLNHEKFDVRIDVNSEKATDVVVRMFLGPKYDSNGNKIDINKNRYNFFEMDSFIYSLKVGKQTIVRNSREFLLTRKDRTPARNLMKHIDNSLNGGEEFVLDMSEGHNLFPDRLLLPRGKKSGMVFQFYVIISSHHEPKVAIGKGYPMSVSDGVGSGARRFDDRALGYPFDRRIDEYNFYTKNMFMKDVVIYHKSRQGDRHSFRDDRFFMNNKNVINKDNLSGEKFMDDNMKVNYGDFLDSNSGFMNRDIVMDMNTGFLEKKY